MKADRVARDKRVEDATTAAYAALDARDAAQDALARADEQLVSALEQLRAEGEPVANIATLTGLAAADVRRMLSGQSKKQQPTATAGQSPADEHVAQPAAEGRPVAVAG
ncbi:MAG: hypothetical protein ABIP57_22205 [Jatrophihabitantaceae bacterium]